MIETKIRTIKLEYIKDVYQFVTLACRVNDEIEVTNGSFKVDGKSLMGMFAIDPSKKFAVEYPADATEFDAFVSTFAVK